ncbi:RYamide neuropeptides [Drosophila erecta]|uniref:RYamide neuropeptides n=1 Tax=Drosophila erecta TaxID=7220 RepID=UPI000F05E541|nr:RYamide neuropeptides [Drosophila erecta]
MSIYEWDLFKPGSQKRTAFFVGSRYGRSGSTTYDESIKSRRIFIVPRNEHFFLGSRYGKRSGKYLPTYEGNKHADSPERIWKQLERTNSKLKLYNHALSDAKF